MKLVYSRFAIKGPMKDGSLKSCAVVSFFTPIRSQPDSAVRVDYTGFCDNVFYIGVPDFDEEGIDEYGLAYQSFITDVKRLAAFIYNAKANNLDIVCQCDFGMSRSPGCAAAILEHFEGRGKEIFENDEYWPNLFVYEKVLNALETYKAENINK